MPGRCALGRRPQASGNQLQADFPDYLTVKIERNARQKTLKKAFEEGEIKAKWEGSAWASKLAKQQVRAKLNDFDRFKLMVARKQKAVIVNKKVKALKKSA
eukprot:CAMPEP_0113934466 /NCGR_PEP_ID=MMETSP1339-20121228/1783_1 /TAXON_ID=94617 /ORGANISM="Fibrocapsa japonica" /LENGTH=100 /DNA_ID=CAMNT_0000936285 /DNA_START=207 /DNA_END=510 /DNA_ORIENTATION=- /assembly_acc=CAM_ASM_000762